MKSLKLWIVRAFIGKNAASYGRALTHLLAGLILSSVLFQSGAVDLSGAPIPGSAAIDPDLREAADAVAVSRAEIEDGLTPEELVKVILGIALAWLSRVFSWLRARNLDVVAKVLGFIIGRSIWSLVRFLLESMAGAFVYFGVMPGASPEALAGMPVPDLLSALILFVSARLLSGTEDAKRNPNPLEEKVSILTMPPVR